MSALTKFDDNTAKDLARLDQLLLEQARAGSIPTTIEFLNRHMGNLYFIAWVLLQDARVSAEIVTQSFLALLVDEQQTPAIPSLWLLSEVIRRSQRVMTAKVLPGRDELETAARALPLPFRVVFLLRTAGVTFKEIAPSLRIKPSTARTRMMRAMRKMPAEIRSGLEATVDRIRAAVPPPPAQMAEQVLAHWVRPNTKRTNGFGRSIAPIVRSARSVPVTNTVA